MPTKQTTVFIPGAIYGLEDAACTIMGGEQVSPTLHSRTTATYCKMEGYPTAYQCAEGLIISIGGAPGRFRMHISGEDAFHPITLERDGDEQVHWTGAQGTLTSQIQNQFGGHVFRRNTIEVACQPYQYQ